MTKRFHLSLSLSLHHLDFSRDTVENVTSMISTTTTTSYDPTTLQPLLSSLAQYLFLLFLLFLYYLNSHSYLRMGFDSILSGEAFTRSSIDWSRTTTSNLEGNNTTSHKGMRRKYVDTKQGREAWESASQSFFLCLSLSRSHECRN